MPFWPPFCESEANFRYGKIFIPVVETLVVDTKILITGLARLLI